MITTTFRTNIIMDFLNMLKMVLNAIRGKINFNFLVRKGNYFPGSPVIVEKFGETEILLGRI